MIGQSPIRRRRLIQAGLGGAALLAAAGALRWFAGGYSGLLAPGERPIALSAKEFAVVKAVVRALLPGDGDLPSGDSLGIAQRIDEEVWAASPAMQSDLTAGLQVIEHAPPLYGFGGRLTSLDPEAARRFWARIAAGSNDTLRQIASALKQIAHLFYYAHPATWRAIGYDGPFVGKPVPPESHVRYAEILRSGARS